MFKIWERYIFGQFLKLFALFLLGFYFLYVVIDYSTHMQEYLQGAGIPYLKVALYYALQFIKRADLLFPLALLVGTIKTVCGLNIHRELLSFQSAGIQIKKLMRPLFTIAWLTAALIMTINEYVVPLSLNFIDRFYDSHLGHTYRAKNADPIRVMHLSDHSKLLYQYYDTAKDSFFDAIWIRSSDDLWKMKYLKADSENPEGEWVDHLQRTANGSFEKVESFSSYIFKELHWDEDLPERGYVPFENYSITGLWRFWKQDPLLTSAEREEVFTQLVYKISMPFLPLLSLLAIIPFCIHFSRNFQPFFLYGIGIFGFVAFVAFLDAAVILGENATVSPLIGIVSPFIILLSIFGVRFAKC